MPKPKSKKPGTKNTQDKTKGFNAPEPLTDVAEVIQTQVIEEAVPGDISITLPTAEIHDGYQSDRIDMHLNNREKSALTMLMQGCKGSAKQYTRKDGHLFYVNTRVDAIRYLLGLVADELDLPVSKA